MTYHVSFQQTGAMPRDIGDFATMSEAREAAARNGAILPSPSSTMGGSIALEVEGHAGDDNFAIWIEGPPFKIMSSVEMKKIAADLHRIADRLASGGEAKLQRTLRRRAVNQRRNAHAD